MIATADPEILKQYNIDDDWLKAHRHHLSRHMFFYQRDDETMFVTFTPLFRGGMFHTAGSISDDVCAGFKQGYLGIDTNKFISNYLHFYLRMKNHGTDEQASETFGVGTDAYLPQALQETCDAVEDDGIFKPCMAAPNVLLDEYKGLCGTLRVPEDINTVGKLKSYLKKTADIVYHEAISYPATWYSRQTVALIGAWFASTLTTIVDRMTGVASWKYVITGRNPALAPILRGALHRIDEVILYDDHTTL